MSSRFVVGMTTLVAHVDHPQRLTRRHTPRYLLPLGQRQVSWRPCPRFGTDPAPRFDKRSYRTRRPSQITTNQPVRFTGLPPIPNLNPFRLGESPHNNLLDKRQHSHRQVLHSPPETAAVMGAVSTVERP